MKEDTPNRRQNSFDQLRLIAAFFVIITHSYALLGLPETDVLYLVTRGATSFSTFGLWIFFVISGYLGLNGQNGRLEFRFSFQNFINKFYFSFANKTSVNIE